MVFSSLVFLWIFLPVVFTLYFTAKEQYRNVILLIASLFFYAWGEPVYVLVMILSIIINYFCGLRIGAAEEHKRKRALFWAVFVNLALLGVFKYTGFFTENVNAIFGLQVEVKHLPLPIGISFYTFQSISYLVDIYRKVCEPQRNIIKMGLFISFFPQLIAGPILKYYDIASQIDKRQVTLPLFNEGAVRFLQGLAKKVIIANIMAKTADEIFALGLNDLSTPAAWIGIIAYTFHSKSILIFQDIRIWQLVWVRCLVSRFMRTLIILIQLRPLKTFGGGGIFRFLLGLRNIYIFRWAETGKGR